MLGRGRADFVYGDIEYMTLPTLNLSLVPAPDGKQRISDPLGEYEPLPPPVAGTPTFADRTHTVTATATGGGDGSDENPWTLKEACTKCTPGSIIGVKAGIYVGERGMGLYPDTLPYEKHCAWHCRVSGTAEQPIFFVAEYPAAYTTNQAEYTDLRSGATVVGEGWPVFGQFSGTDVPQVSHIHWIGMYSDDRDTNNRQNFGESCMAGFFNRGDYGSMRLCRLVRGNDMWNAGSTNGNKSHFRNELTNYTTYSDNHLSIVDAEQSSNNACWIVYLSKFTTIHNNTCVTNTTKPMCLYVKVGEPRGRAIEGIRFYNNRTENFYQHIRLLGPTIDSLGEAYRCHFYNNLSIGGDAFFTWSTADGVRRLNGCRFHNNTVVGMNTHIFGLTQPHDDVPELNPRDITFYNNISYNNRDYIGANNTTPKVPPGLAWCAQFAIFNRNCVWGHTNVIRVDTDPDLKNKTWEEWTGYIDPDPLRITDHNSVIADPDFVDEVDYKLNPGSPCEALGRDYYGFHGPTGAVIPAGCYVTGDEIMGVR
jgi:hypothetical protein